MNITVTATASPTLIPAAFKDPEKALAGMVAAKQALDAATAKLRDRERADAEKRAQRSHFVRNHDGIDEAFQRDQAYLQPLVVEMERARSEYDVAFAIYQETARARDARAANALAESNNAVAATNARVSKWIAWITLAVAVAATVQTAAMVVQIVHTWSAHP